MRQAFSTISLSETEARRLVGVVERARDLLSAGRPSDEAVQAWLDLGEVVNLLERGVVDEVEFAPLRDEWQRPVIPATVPSAGTER